MIRSDNNDERNPPYEIFQSNDEDLRRFKIYLSNIFHNKQ